MESEADKETLKALGEMLNLHDSEAKTMAAVLRHCSKFGMTTGGGIAVATAGVGAVMVPGVGSVPGWLVGFASGFAGGTLVCTIAHRGIVVEGLKRLMSEGGEEVGGEGAAVFRLRTTLARLGDG